MPDSDGYPTDDELDSIALWKIASQADIDDLWDFCRSLWTYPDRFVEMHEDHRSEEWTSDANWCVSTGGWSGNEEVIGALKRNYMFWALCWRVSRVGGHYGFKIGNVIHVPTLVPPEPSGAPSSGAGRNPPPGDGSESV